MPGDVRHRNTAISVGAGLVWSFERISSITSRPATAHAVALQLTKARDRWFKNWSDRVSELVQYRPETSHAVTLALTKGAGQVVQDDVALRDDPRCNAAACKGTVQAEQIC